MADGLEENQVLMPLDPEEAKQVLAAFEEFKKSHGVALNARPVFADDGRVEVEARFFRLATKAGRPKAGEATPAEGA